MKNLTAIFAFVLPIIANASDITKSDTQTIEKNQKIKYTPGYSDKTLCYEYEDSLPEVSDCFLDKEMDFISYEDGGEIYYYPKSLIKFETDDTQLLNSNQNLNSFTQKHASTIFVFDDLHENKTSQIIPFEENFPTAITISEYHEMLCGCVGHEELRKVLELFLFQETSE